MGRKDIKRPGIGSGGHNRVKTHCKHGHPFTEKNTYLTSNGRNCKVCQLIRTRKNNLKYKQAFVAAYGGKCAWPGCDVTDIDMLTLDHVNNDGKQHRASVSNAHGSGIYRIVAHEGYPAKYQPLCANHQLKKELIRSRAEIYAAT